MSETCAYEDVGEIEIRFQRRRYPGTVFVWAFWRLRALGIDAPWNNAGDPDQGKGAAARMRAECLSQSKLGR